MRVRTVLKKMCKDCYFVTRKGVRRVYCKANKRHNHRQGFHTLITADSSFQSMVPIVENTSTLLKNFMTKKAYKFGQSFSMFKL